MKKNCLEESLKFSPDKAMKKFISTIEKKQKMIKEDLK